MASFSIHPADDLIPQGLVGLAVTAEAEGIRIVTAVIDGWRNGTQRYELPGECLLAATDRTGSAVGIGGLSRCPHVAGAYRVRRFYVDPQWRHHGVARTLAKQLIDLGFDHSDTLTCNAGASDAAVPFWETMGFVPSGRAEITHTRTRQTLERRRSRPVTSSP
ncbi:MAG: GNAT family N-acetyltransferase [Actinomycetia bacterium]|nr:GNAT family N-acetyltransferase [Actinomycetes bacterium]